MMVPGKKAAARRFHASGGDIFSQKKGLVW
jgi:hypothetical protein